MSCGGSTPTCRDGRQGRGSVGKRECAAPVGDADGAQRSEVARIAGAVFRARVAAGWRGADCEELDRELQCLGDAQDVWGAGRASPFSN